MEVKMMPTISLHDLLQAIEIQYDIHISFMDALDWLGASSSYGYFAFDYGNLDEDVYFDPAIVCIRSYLRDVIPNSKKVLIRI